MLNDEFEAQPKKSSQTMIQVNKRVKLADPNDITRLREP